ncbi:tRNA preQ1(34) S-adenosylmethionine ribosyltransferase-isomerase QueA [Candidatus Gracilibacteria bacterium]|nr:tRNA preQ1(34) S-adenosylmethionine ribosyltransferase-isomerase QueA [Candidatus Gracilibacteria bacterium]NUJ98673.1 tRNA preQ1(34) S-adenosylmethionine ribosyltransferase-isomerase QueA [Candidatus Gracilibacteria bacterium]
MKLSDFDYILPKELIAQTPTNPRDHSRLLLLNKNTGEIEEKKFFEIAQLLGENDVLVLNKTEVINARLKGKREDGEDAEIFLHKQINQNTWDCLVYPGKKLKRGAKVFFEKDDIFLSAEIKELSENGRIVEFSLSGEDFMEAIKIIGETPLPPYIKEKLEDSSRYQTVYGEDSGSVAAPTAGLHFTEELLEKLKKKGVKIEKVLLHVGLGTFKGVEKENIVEHTMHSEFCEIQEDVAKRLNTYKKQGKRIIAVGTTSVRTLESFAQENGELSSGTKETTIFIYPGYHWKFVESIITNFHLPKSTLLMLVSSFAGQENIKKAYQQAIDQQFRFFSFGDAMWIY